MELYVSKNNALFSTSFSGFKKSEVVEYIEEQNRKIKMEREAAEYERNTLSADVTTLTEENNQNQGNVSEWKNVSLE